MYTLTPLPDLIAAIASIAAVMIGYDSAFIGTTISLSSFKSEFGFGKMTTKETDLISANIVSCYQAGCFFGALVSQKKNSFPRLHLHITSFRICSPFSTPPARIRSRSTPRTEMGSPGFIDALHLGSGSHARSHRRTRSRSDLREFGIGKPFTFHSVGLGFRCSPARSVRVLPIYVTGRTCYRRTRDRRRFQSDTDLDQ